MHLDQSALGILRKAEDKNGRKYMDWRIPYMDQPGLIMVYKSDSRYEKYMIYFFTSPASKCHGKYLHTTYGSIQVEDGSLTIRTKNSVYVVGVFSAYAYSRIMVNISQGTMLKLRTELFSNMESLPIRYFDTHAHGDIMSVYTNDVDTLRQLFGQSIPQVINSAVTIVATLISMLILNIPLAFLSVLMSILMLVVTKKISGLSGKYFYEQQKDLGTVDGFIEEMMDGQ